MFKFVESDILIASYPRSGNTWMRFLLANLIYPDCVWNANWIQMFCPDTHQVCKEMVRKIKAPRILKTHIPKAQKGRCIYLIRNPYEICSSYYGRYIRRNSRTQTDFNSFVRKFVKGKVGGYSRWDSHVESWSDKPGLEGYYIRYEDILQASSFNKVLIEIAETLFDKKVTIRDVQVAMVKARLQQQRVRTKHKPALTREHKDLIYGEFATTMEKFNYRR